MKRWAAAACLGAAFMLVACGSATGPDSSDVPLAGDWRYDSGHQSGYSASGVLRLTDGAERRISGSLSVQWSLPDGGTGAESGTVSGVRTARAVDFDVITSAAVRHVGEIRGDTISGSWLEPGTTPRVGWFRAVRERSP
jgi:hypothetical protein